MPRISNKVIYNQDATPNLKDYVIGTDINDYKRTKNYNLKSIFNLFNNANGVSNNLYKFSLVEDEENYLTPGVLSLESTNLNGVFTIYLNKENTEGTNLSVLFAKMDEGFSGRHHKLRLESASDKNFFINLNIRDMISYADYISIEVELSDAGRIGDLIQESFYVVSFIVDEAHYEISQQIKLDDTEGNIDQLVTSAINKLPRFYVKPNETRSVFVDFVSGNSLYRKHWRLRYSGRYYGVGHPISYHSHIKVDHVEILVQNISNQGNIVDLGEIGLPTLDNEGNPINRELHLSNYINRLGTSITLKLGNVVTALFNTEEYNFYFNGDEALYGINDEETVEENFNEFDSEEVPIDVEVNNGIEPYYISPEPTPQTENFFIDVIIADNINNRAQQIPQSSKLIYIYTLFQYGGQSFRKIWVLDNSNRAYGQGTPPIGAGNLVEFNTQALQQNSVVDLGDIGALAGNETYEEHLRDYINAQDPSIGLINSGTIRADFGGDVREFNFSNVTGDYGLNVNQTDVTDFQLYGESNNEEDAGTIVTNTSQLVNDGEDGSSRFIEEDELGTIAYEDSNQYIKQQEREIPNGIATLDGAGKLKTAQIPDLAITDVVTPTETTIEAFVANNTNYTYQQGDVIVIDDGSGDVTHNMYKGGDKSLVTSYSEINATEFAISQINGLQGELDNTVKKTGELLQTVQGRVFEFISDNTSNFLRAKNVNGANIALVQTGETGFIQASTSVNQNGRLILSGASGQPLTELKVRIDGSIDNKEIYHEGNLPTSPTGIKAENSVQKTGETSQNVAGTLSADKHKTNGGDGTNLIDDNGDLVPKNLSSFQDDIGATEAIAPFKIFVDKTNGDNLTGIIENKERPFADVDFAISKIPDDRLWEIVLITDEVYPLNGLIPLTNIKFSSVERATLSFNSNTNQNILQTSSANAANPFKIIFDLPNGELHFEQSGNTNSSSFQFCDIYINVNILRVGDAFRFYRTYGFSTDVRLLYLEGNLVDWISRANGISTIRIDNIIGTGDINILGNIQMDPRSTLNFINNSITTDGKLKLNVQAREGTGSFVNMRLSNITCSETLLSELNTDGGDDTSNVNYYWTNGEINGKVEFAMKYCRFFGDLIINNPFSSGQVFTGATYHYLNNGNLDVRGFGEIILGNTTNLILSNYNIKTDGAILARWQGNDFDYTLEDSKFIINGYSTYVNEGIKENLFEYSVSSISGVVFEINGDFSTNKKITSNIFPESITIIKNTFSSSEKTKEVTIKTKGQLLSQPLDLSKTYIIDGTITLEAGEFIEPLVGGNLTISGYGLEASKIIKNVTGESIFKSPAGGSGGLQIQGISFETTGKVFDLIDATGFNAIEANVVNFDGCFEIGELSGYRQFLGTTIGIYGCENGFTLSGTWNGFKITNTNSFGSLFNNGVLFKAGAGLIFSNRFYAELNVSIPNGGVLSDFSPSNFSSDKLFQLKNGQYSYNGTTDVLNTTSLLPNITSKDTEVLWQGNQGIQDSVFKVFDFDVSQLGSYVDDTDASTGGVEIGEAYFDSTTGYLKRRVS